MDMEKYEAVLTDIGERLRLVRQLLEQPVIRIEWIAIELRIVLELIVLGSLVTNRSAISKVSSVFKVKEVSEARKLVATVNVDYWPTPFERGPDGEDGGLSGQPVGSGFLKEDEWGREYGFLSDLVHAEHPYENSRDRASEGEALRSLFYRIAILLRQHMIVLAGNQDAYIGQLDIDAGEVVIAILRRPESTSTAPGGTGGRPAK
jgi:hypothetical protein